MSTLARNAGLLALLGGTVWVVSTVALLVIPSSYAWVGLIVAMAVIGGAALGLQQQVGARSGSLGRWAAVATAAGSIATLALVLIALATSGGNMATPPPQVVLVLSLAAFVLWFVGSIVFALSLIRAKAIPAVAGWLIVVGAAVGTVGLFASGQTPSPLLFVLLGMYGVGWMLVGLAARTTTAPELNVAGQPS
jgi:hypothetical protein